MLVDNSTSNQASLPIPPVSYLQERFKSSPLPLRLISWKVVSPHSFIISDMFLELS